MKSIKKIFSFLLILCTILLSSSIAFAADNSLDTNLNSSCAISSLIKSDNINLDISQSDVFIEEHNGTQPKGTGIVAYGPFAARDGSTEIVDIYMNYTGPYICNGVRFKKMTVKNASSLNSEVYATIGNGTFYSTYNVTANYVVNAYITSAFIPEDVEKLKVTIIDGQFYCMDHKEWHSATSGDFTIKIN